MSLKDPLKSLIAGTRLESPARHAARLIRGSRGRELTGIAMSRRYDRLTDEVLAAVLERESCCIDAGAHQGRFLREMVRLAPGGRHFGFEPIPVLAERLSRELPQAEIMPVALADWTGTAPFRHVVDDPGYSGFERRPWDTYAEQSVELIEVEVRRLDDVIPADLPIRMIKVDVEGSECQLLRGGLRTLQAHQPFVAFELGEKPADAYEILGEGAGLEISLLEDWLASRPALTREQLIEERLSGRNFFFLAHPPR